MNKIANDAGIDTPDVEGHTMDFYLNLAEVESVGSGK